MFRKSQAVGSAAAFVAHSQFGTIVGAVVDAVSDSLGQFWSSLISQTCPESTGLHALSVTQAAVDPVKRPLQRNNTITIPSPAAKEW